MKAIAAMVADGADEVVLETEITNEPALGLYENLGFVRDKRLFQYYLFCRNRQSLPHSSYYIILTS